MVNQVHDQCFLQHTCSVASAVCFNIKLYIFRVHFLECLEIMKSMEMNDTFCLFIVKS